MFVFIIVLISSIYYNITVQLLKNSSLVRFLVSVGDYRDNSVILWSAYNGETRPVVLATSRYAHPIHHVTIL